MRKSLFLFVIFTTLMLIVIAGCNDSAKTTEDNENHEPTDWSKVSWEWSSPYEEPKGDKIVFISNRDGNYEIYMVNIDASELKRVTDSLGNEYWPDLSPDGNKVTFTYPHSIKSEEDSEIFIINIDGSERKNLTDNEVDDWDPCFSPDGFKIAFFSTRDGNSEIYIMNIDGTGQTRLTNNPGDDWDPCFSPDGTKIAFTSERDGNKEIYIMNVDGSNQTRLTYNDEEKCLGNSSKDENPLFSLDGKNIAFESNCKGAGIFIMNVDGSAQEEFIGFYSNWESYCLSPDWSKFVVEEDYGPEYEEGNEIFIYNVSDKHNQYGINLSNNPASDGSPSF